MATVFRVTLPLSYADTSFVSAAFGAGSDSEDCSVIAPVPAPALPPADDPPVAQELSSAAPETASAPESRLLRVKALVVICPPRHICRRSDGCGGAGSVGQEERGA